MSQLFESGGQIIRASASASVLPMNIQGWFLLRLTGLISLQSPSYWALVFNMLGIKESVYSGDTVAVSMWTIGGGGWIPGLAFSHMGSKA